MWHKECWTKYENGHYGYKNGITVKREGPNLWVVFTVINGKKNTLFASDTLAACKYWLEHHYN